MSLKLPEARQQFAFFRIVFGSYLFVHFMLLIPYGAELFSSEGMIANANLLPAARVFPNILTFSDSPFSITVFLYALAFAAALFAAGIARPVVSVFLWYGWACLFNRNIFISNPGLPMVGWLLLACSLIPQGEGLRVKGMSSWHIPRELYAGAWVIMAVGYTAGGIHKLGAPSWPNGSAIARLLENPLARDNSIREMLFYMPWTTKIMTYLSLGMEILFLPLALWSRTRPFIWLGMTGMQLGILTVINSADLILGVLMMHLFTFDYRWLQRQHQH